MPAGTWEEAKRCPRCDQVGEHVERETRAVKSGSKGAKLHKFYCRNPRCRWNNTPWEVQVNADGTIPDPEAPRQRQMPKPDMALAAQMRAAAEAAHVASLEGREVRGR